MTIQNPVTIGQYLYYLVSPKYLSALCTTAYTNTYSIQTFSKKAGTLNRTCNSTSCKPNTQQFRAKQLSFRNVYCSVQSIRHCRSQHTT